MKNAREERDYIKTLKENGKHRNDKSATRSFILNDK